MTTTMTAGPEIPVTDPSADDRTWATAAYEDYLNGYYDNDSLSNQVTDDDRAEPGFLAAWSLTNLGGFFRSRFGIEDRDIVKVALYKDDDRVFGREFRVVTRAYVLSEPAHGLFRSIARASAVQAASVLFSPSDERVMTELVNAGLVRVRKLGGQPDERDGVWITDPGAAYALEFGFIVR